MPKLLTNISRREQHALAILFLLFLGGHIVRALATAPGAPPAAALLFDPAGDGDPIAHRDSIRQQAQPLGATERIDVDRASALELTRLPGVGPALANRIVADRESNGAFGTVAGLRRVRGIGPALVERVRSHLSFGGVSAEAQTTNQTGTVELNKATVADLVGLPGIGPARARAIVAFRDSAGPFRQLTDLKMVRGIPASLIGQLAGRLLVP